MRQGPKPLSAAAAPYLAAMIVVAVALSFGSCAGRVPSGKKTIVVTYSILGTLVQDLVGERFRVLVSIPEGLDLHEWEPSAKDIEAIDGADLVVENGLGLEGGLAKTLDQARKAGVKFFTASDHVLARTVGADEGIPPGDPYRAVGAQDPHLWTDPVTMQAIIDALAEEIDADFHVDLSTRRVDLDARLEALDAEIALKAANIPEEERRLVTGHESMGYFAQRYGFKIVGAVVPSLSTEAESSAPDLVELKKLIALDRVTVVFTELGENPKVAEVLAREAHVASVPLVTHSLPKGEDYFGFVRSLADAIVGALANNRNPPRPLS